jgi:hypothetical protein
VGGRVGGWEGGITTHTHKRETNGDRSSILMISFLRVLILRRKSMTQLASLIRALALAKSSRALLSRSDTSSCPRCAAAKDSYSTMRVRVCA